MLTVYRFAHELYKNDLSGTGAMHFGGRWNSIGLPAVYCSYSISLAMIELFVHKQCVEQVKNMYLLEIEIATPATVTIANNKLKTWWQKDIDYCQYIGNQFLQNTTLLSLSVPSAIIPQENNIVLNPKATGFTKKVKIKKTQLFDFDERLFK